MRILKFRAWEAELSHMHHGNRYCDLPLNEQGLLQRRGFYFTQFTGLLDDNGVEIFEGDICRVLQPDYLMDEPVLYAIAWYQGFCNFCYLPLEYAAEGLDNWGDAFQGQLTYHHEKTVVGNVFENPELLPKT